MKKIVFLSALSLLFVGCASDDHNYNIDGNFPTGNGVFDYSTVDDVQLQVDYSALAPQGQVYFSVYSENPIKDDELNENIKPVFSSYTGVDGVYNEKVTLPSYATDLYVYSGDFFVGGRVYNTKVANHQATVIADGTAAAAPVRRAMRASALSDDWTNSLATLYQLSNLVNWRTGEDTGNQIFKPWKTWLGKWDRMSGRPQYLLQSTDPDYAKLTFTEEEKAGLYQAITGAITRKQTCPMAYRQSADLTLTEPSQVSVTLIGSNTCWNNTIGYYYYTGDAPTSDDVNVVMLFPNTQDGRSEFIKGRGNNYYGNIALDRGDVVKLMYYPNIATGSEAGATDVFPAGTKIGFLLKSNGWGMQADQGDKKFHNSYLGQMSGATIARQYNCWSASTDGISYCPRNDEQNAADPGSVGKPNTDRVARTAKFAYQNDEGQQYAVVSFEDAANDEDYGDVILAMKPVGVFETLPTVAPRVSTTNGVYSFEDLWPRKGDFDMNDAVIDYQEDREFSVLDYGDSYKVTKQTFSLTTYRNYVTLTNGLALTLNTKVNPSKIVMKKKMPNSSEFVETTFQKDGNVYLIEPDMLNVVGATYVLELSYSTGIADSQAATVKPFIYRAEGNSRWEVHIPMEAPTDKMNYSYFGTWDDKSDPANKIYYVCEGNYPFAFFLSGVTVNVFKNTILKDENEKKPIDVFFPEFIEWSTSNGTKNKDWYKHPVVQ